MARLPLLGVRSFLAVAIAGLLLIVAPLAAAAESDPWTLVPSAVTGGADGGVALNGSGSIVAVGTPGGGRIINTILQVLVNVIDFKLNIDEATHQPRISQNEGPLEVEPNFNPDTLALLRAKGHDIKQSETMGSAQSIAIENGYFFGAADPRRPGAAASPGPRRDGAPLHSQPARRRRPRIALLDPSADRRPGAPPAGDGGRGGSVTAPTGARYRGRTEMSWTRPGPLRPLRTRNSSVPSPSISMATTDSATPPRSVAGVSSHVYRLPVPSLRRIASG